MNTTSQGNPVFLDPPRLQANPNPRVPLAAVLAFRADREVSTSVEISDGTLSRALDFTAAWSPDRGLPLIGLRADRVHRCSVVITDGTGRSTRWPDTLEYRTPALPPCVDFPPLKLAVSQPQRMEPGITLLSVRRRAPGKEPAWTAAQKRFTEQWGMLLAIDAQGEVLWYCQEQKRIAGVTRLANGNIFYHMIDSRSVEIDVLGNVVRQIYAARRPAGPVAGAIAVDAQSLHHQPHQLPNGNLLAMTANARLIDNYPTSEVDPQAPRKPTKVVGDRIVEIRESDGEVVWSWNTFDHLDPQRIAYNFLDLYWHVRGFPDHADWTHGNGVTHDPRDDSVIMSLRNQDAVIKVERATGRIKWILGEPSDWGPLAERVLRPVGEDFRWPYHGHNPRITRDGTLIMYDNGLMQARPFAKPIGPEHTVSRAVEYAIDETAMTVRQVWTSNTPDSPDACLSFAMGDAHRLPHTDNRLVIHSTCSRERRADFTPFFNYRPGTRHPNEFPMWARIIEYATATGTPVGGDVVFELHVADPNDLVQWQVFGGQRITSLYPSGITERPLE